MNTNTHTLIEPLVIKTKETGEEISRVDSITFRPLKGGDLLTAMDTSAGKPGSYLRDLIARSTTLSHAQVDNMCSEDIGECIERVQAFLPRGLTTGDLA
tara:strand:- start:15197 stop:15493 length:297 start_codon:yes stop_codon:yes gene_type:complete